MVVRETLLQSKGRNEEPEKSWSFTPLLHAPETSTGYLDRKDSWFFHWGFTKPSGPPNSSGWNVLGKNFTAVSQPAALTQVSSTSLAYGRPWERLSCRHRQTVNQSILPTCKHARKICDSRPHFPLQPWTPAAEHRLQRGTRKKQEATGSDTR